MKRTLWPLALACLLVSVTASGAAEPPLICFGTEPFWRLDLTEPGKASFSTPDTEAEDYLGAASTLLPRKEVMWRGRAALPDGGELVAFLREGPCSDGMSDTTHPYSINVSLPDGRHLAGCCRVADDVQAGASRLEGATWRLTELPGRELPAAGARDAVTVRFEAGRVEGFSGCNQLTGSYTLEGETLILGTLGATMRACAEPAMAIERRFLEAFSGTLDVVVAGDSLSLGSPTGGEALRFERQAPPSLQGVEWEVTGYNNGRQAVVSPLTGTRITLSFRSGTVAGSSGCNDFRGTFEVDGNALEVGPLATTRKACEDAVMAQERAFLAALEAATTWEVARGMLDLHRADGERALWATPAGEQE